MEVKKTNIETAEQAAKNNDEVQTTFDTKFGEVSKAYMMSDRDVEVYDEPKEVK